MALLGRHALVFFLGGLCAVLLFVIAWQQAVAPSLDAGAGAAPAGEPPPLPALDLSAPAATRTATFSLG